MTTNEKIKKYIVENFMFDANARVSDYDDLIGGGIVDSTGILELIAWVEEEFGVKVPDDALVPENFGTVPQIVAYLEKQGVKSDG